MLKIKLFFEKYYTPGKFFKEFRELVGDGVYNETEPRQDGDQVILSVPDNSRILIFDSLKRCPILLQKPLNT